MTCQTNCMGPNMPTLYYNAVNASVLHMWVKCQPYFSTRCWYLPNLFLKYKMRLFFIDPYLDTSSRILWTIYKKKPGWNALYMIILIRQYLFYGQFIKKKKGWHDYIHIHYILYSHDTHGHKIHIHDHVIDKLPNFN
jgi:hypothetical protein